MALGAHEIPVLVQLGPVQHVVVADVFVRIEMKPALAALILRPRVPGNRQRLDAPVREFDQVLLQGIDAERVLDLECCELAVRAVGLNEKLSILAEEARRHPVVVERRAGKIAQHCSICGVGHCLLVLRGLPEFRFGLMATGAGLAADIGCGCRCAGFCRNERRPGNTATNQPGRGAHAHQNDCSEGPHDASGRTPGRAVAGRRAFAFICFESLPWLAIRTGHR